MLDFKEIRIKYVPQHEQRYDTCGDWYFVNDAGEIDPNGKILQIVASKTQDKRHQTLVAVHELIEALLCKHNGVSVEAVDDFDITGEGLLAEEPGEHPLCPYYVEHAIATGLERTLARCLSVVWADYDAAVKDKGVVEGAS